MQVETCTNMSLLQVAWLPLNLTMKSLRRLHSHTIVRKFNWLFDNRKSVE